MPPEETHSQPGLVAASDEAVLHLHHSPPLPSSVIGHRDHKRKRSKHDGANDDALPPEEFTAAWSTIDADRAATEPATPTGGAHRSQRRAPAAERAGAGGSSSKDDKASSPSVAPPPAASSKAIRVKHSSSSSFVIGGGGGKQHPTAGSGKQHPTAGSGSSPGGGSHSEYANSHAAAAPSSSSRLVIRGPAAPPPHLPPKARRPPSASAAPSAAVRLEPDDDYDERFRRGVEVFGEWDVATQQAAVNRFVRQQPPPEGGAFSFWLTPKQADDDLKYVHEMVMKARREAAASGSGKPPRRH